jgi:glycosyltransferase family 11
MTAYKGVNLYIGYWQSALYFQSVIDEITCKFTFSIERLSDYSKKILHIVERCQSVSVHIRRGDYLLSANIDSVGFICNLSYYRLAMEYMEDCLDNAYFFIFSDEVGWAEEHISGENIMVVSGNSGKDAWQDMCLMSKCRHHIIANSTFSWWGAWLGQNEDKFVVAPSRFSKNIIDEDLIPSSWIRNLNQHE